MGHPFLIRLYGYKLGAERDGIATPDRVRFPMGATLSLLVR